MIYKKFIKNLQLILFFPGSNMIFQPKIFNYFEKLGQKPKFEYFMISTVNYKYRMSPFLFNFLFVKLVKWIPYKKYGNKIMCQVTPSLGPSLTL
jgi:hypothetical protein